MQIQRRRLGCSSLLMSDYAALIRSTGVACRCGLMTPRISHAPVCQTKLTSVMQHGTNAFALVEQVEGFVDFFERHVVGDELIDLDLTAHVLFHVTRK